MKSKYVFLVLAGVISGCATTPSPEQQELRAAVARTIPTCRETKECEVKWAAARSWILANSGWKLQHIQPDFMETYNSVDGSTSLAVRVTKEPDQSGAYRILATVWCDNIFGCNPDKWQALKNFNRYVNDSWRSD